MHTIRHLIIDFIFISAFCCSLGLSATESSTVLSQEMCMDELFQVDAVSYDQSVLRTSYKDNGVEVKYEVVVASSGEAYILKDNTTRVKTLTYTSGDYFKARLLPTVLEIYQNSTLVFSQAITPTASYQTSSSIIEDKLNKVEFDYIDGYCESNGVYTKCESDGWGNAGFVSKNVLKLADDGEIRWTVQELDKYKMLGLGIYSTSKHYTGITYAIYQPTNRFGIYESGSYKAGGPNVKLGDIIRIKKESNKIKYYLNDQLVYTSHINVSGDLYIRGAGNKNGSLIQNVEASFTEDHQLYTLSSVYNNFNGVNWNKLSHYQVDDKTGNLYSITGNSSALSEIYYQTDLGHSSVSIEPDLTKLFHPQFKSTEISLAIGLKTYKEGIYLEREVSYDRMFSGFVFERTRDGDPRLFIRNEGQLIGVDPYEEGEKYNIRIDKGRVFFEKDRGDGKRVVLYSRTIDPSMKYLVYQGAGLVGSPFLTVKSSGFENIETAVTSYNYDGDNDLIEVHQGDVFKILKETGQEHIKHKVGWKNCKNIKGSSEGGTIYQVSDLEEPQFSGEGESIFKFTPSEELETKFIYREGDFKLGVKPILENTSKVYAGLNVSSGVLSVINKISGSSKTIKSGDIIGMAMTGNGTINISLNGASVGIAQMPQTLSNLVFNVSNGGIISVLTFNSLQSTLAVTTPEPYVVQSQYRSDCTQNLNSFIRIENMSQSLILPVQIEITNLNTGQVTPLSFLVSPQTVSNYIVNLPIGVYELSAFYNNGFHTRIFEVTTPIRWNEGGPNASQIIFDTPLYNQTNSVSSLELEDDNGDSYSRALNVVQYETVGTYIIPISYNNKGVFDFEMLGFGNAIYRIKNEVGAVNPVFWRINPGGLSAYNNLDPSIKAFKIRMRPMGPNSPLISVEYISMISGGGEIISATSTINTSIFPLPFDPNAYLTLKSNTNEVTPYKFIQAQATVCPNDPPTPLVLAPSAFGYGIMEREYSANFYVARGELRFQFTEDYYLDNQSLNYRIYDVYSDDITGQCAFNPVISTGDNRYMLDLDNLCSGLQLNQQYRIEVMNSKGDKRVLRFLYTN